MVAKPSSRLEVHGTAAIKVSKHQSEFVSGRYWFNDGLETPEAALALYAFSPLGNGIPDAPGLVFPFPALWLLQR